MIHASMQGPPGLLGAQGTQELQAKDFLGQRWAALIL